MHILSSTQSLRDRRKLGGLPESSSSFWQESNAGRSRCAPSGRELGGCPAGTWTQGARTPELAWVSVISSFINEGRGAQPSDRLPRVIKLRGQSQDGPAPESETRGRDGALSARPRSSMEGEASVVCSSMATSLAMSSRGLLSGDADHPRFVTHRSQRAAVTAADHVVCPTSPSPAHWPMGVSRCLWGSTCEIFFILASIMVFKRLGHVSWLHPMPSLWPTLSLCPCVRLHAVLV